MDFILGSGVVASELPLDGGVGNIASLYPVRGPKSESHRVKYV